MVVECLVERRNKRDEKKQINFQEIRMLNSSSEGEEEEGKEVITLSKFKFTKKNISLSVFLLIRKIF